MPRSEALLTPPPICAGADPTEASEADDKRPVSPPTSSCEDGVGEMGRNVCLVINELSDDCERGESEDMDDMLVIEFRLLTPSGE